MANAKTRLQQKAAKERRKKYFAIGGSIVLVAVLAIQVPRTMKMLSGPADENAAAAAEAPATTPETTATATGAPASPTAVPVSAGASGELPDRNAEPAPKDGQLMSFELFEGKDPFVQQVTDTAAEDAAAAAAAAGGTSVTASGAPAPASQPTSSSSSSQTTDQRNLSAVISVNGTQETVKVAHDFPADSPTFRLVSAGAGAAKIGIAGGTLAGGGRTVTLKLGRKLTLVNTADGTRYVLALRSVQ